MADRHSAYADLRQRILHGQFRPGERLPEISLAQAMEVSRTPVREALIALEKDRLVERSATGGFQVSAGTPELVIEIYEARAALESMAAGAAARNREDLDLARLRTIHETSADFSDPQAQHDALLLWHRQVWKAARNTVVAEALDTWITRLHLYDSSGPTPKEDVERSRREHQAIAEAIACGDGDRASALMAEHVGRARHERLRALC